MLMKNIIIAALAVGVASSALAQMLTDGNYNYNDGTGSNQYARVENGGQQMMIQDKHGNEQWFSYNALLDTYVEMDPDPTEKETTIQWKDQKYRSFGVNSDTGVCTLYPI